jgi:LPXTG-site transpeptidase (sortase) family protein
VAGGYAVYRLDPQGWSVIARWLPQQAPPAALATGTPSAGTPRGGKPSSTVNALQQFNAAITSYQAQPMDAHTGLRLIIPRLHINAPIVERGLVSGWMVVAPGDVVTHFIYSAYPGAAGNAILYSHAGTVFRHLDSLAIGDTIVVQTPQGSAQFRVRELRIVAPTDLSVLDTTQTATLTLLTCYPFMVDSSRLVVIADLIGS